jgi:hypothetical protein
MTNLQNNIKMLLCDPSSPHPTAVRVNESKQYVSWEGCTIIMPLVNFSKGSKEHRLVNDIYNRLKNDPVIDCYVALLPPESYHVTLKGICERYKYQNGKEYNSHIESMYIKICEIEQMFAESSIDIIHFNFDIKTIDDAPYCGLSLEFGNAGMDEQNVEQILRNFEQIVMNDLNLSVKKQSWHLTLGYFYKNNGKLNDEEKVLIKCAVKIALIDAMKEHLNPNNNMCTFSFSRPPVCCFKDLTQFNKLSI